MAGSLIGDEPNTREALSFFTSEMIRPYERKPEPKGSLKLPPDTIVVSADNHFSCAEDIWFERFPAHLKSKAPRVWRSQVGALHVGFDGVSLLPEANDVSQAEFERLPGCSDLTARIADLDAAGIDKEIAFPNGIMALLFQPDLQLREYIVRVYNEYLAELQAKAPGRFYGVGFGNWWDPARTRQSLEELKALGLRAFMLPQSAGRDTEGRKIQYQSDYQRPMWEAIEESGLPVAFHIGETAVSTARGEPGISVLQNFAPFRKVAGELVFGGILDNHPGLRVVFAEGGINWVASMLQDMALIYAGHRWTGTWQMRDDIEYYWRRHMYVTFIFDKLGLAMLDMLGADRLLWSQDYPHNEGSLGYEQLALRQVVEATSPDNVRRILGGNALAVWDLS
jgi:predicted TIM-barrel fold metal-dependent hydrolase